MADTTRSESKPRNGQRPRRSKADAAPAGDEAADTGFGHGILEEPPAAPPAEEPESAAEAEP